MPTVTEESIRGHDGTLFSALETWVAANGLATYNPFQSVFFQLKKMPILLDEEGETSAEVQARLGRWYKELQTNVFGLDFRTQRGIRACCWQGWPCRPCRASKRSCVRKRWQDFSRWMCENAKPVVDGRNR